MNGRIDGTAIWKRLLTFAALVPLGCTGTLKLPKSDPTPPRVSLKVEVSGFTTTVWPQGVPITHHFQVFPVELTGHGVDEDGGIKKVSVRGSKHWACVEPNGVLAQSKDALFSYDSPFSFSPKPGDVVLKELYQTAEIQLAEFDCQAPYVLSGLTIEAAAIAENFYGGVTTTQTVTLKSP
jgi:hypothetical protein